MNLKIKGTDYYFDSDAWMAEKRYMEWLEKRHSLQWWNRYTLKEADEVLKLKYPEFYKQS